MQAPSDSAISAEILIAWSCLFHMPNCLGQTVESRAVRRPKYSNLLRVIVIACQQLGYLITDGNDRSSSIVFNSIVKGTEINRNTATETLGLTNLDRSRIEVRILVEIALIYSQYCLGLSHSSNNPSVRLAMHLETPCVV
jgi:hypothetical protein